MRHLDGIALSLALGLIVACTAGKGDVDEDFSDLAALDQKSDAFSYRMRLLGPLASGEARTVTYTGSPRFRAFQIKVNGGDQVDIWVRGPRGDAMAWLLDPSFDVVASNDDADDSTLDSHIAAAIPDSGFHFIVFRDYYLESRRFTVELERRSLDTSADAPSAWLTARLTAPGYDYGAETEFPITEFQMRGDLPAHRERFYGVAGFGSPAVVAWHFLHEDVSFLALIAGVDDRTYVHLFDAEGRWLAHANGRFDGSQISDLVWGVRDPVDHTVCWCDPGAGSERCHWEDGSSTAGEQACD